MESAKPIVDLQNTNPWLFILFSVLFGYLVSMLFMMRRINLPPGSMGLPVIGETLTFLRALKNDQGSEWLQGKIAKYGPVFKTSVMGSPTVILAGQEGNRFLLQHDYTILLHRPPASLTRIMGKNHIGELSGEYHKRMRDAVMQFLKPEALQKFVGRIESNILQHLAEGWEGKESITVWPSMKMLTFKVACDLLFGLTDKQEMEVLGEEFGIAVKGFWSLPFNLPGTTFHKSLIARSQILKRLKCLLEKRRREIRDGKFMGGENLISTMLTMKDGSGKGLTEEEIVDNVIAVMIAGHDTTSVLLTHIVRFLALNPSIYETVLQEQTQVREGKQPNEPLKWGDIQKMKYTWRVAQEALRLRPPIWAGFRKPNTDIEYQGYTIPKGWSVMWVTMTTQKSEEIFKNADEFDPSHFQTTIPPYNFVAFGGGPRICPGYDFAKIETLVVFHHLVLKYKWSLIIPDEKVSLEPMPVLVKGLPIKIHPKGN